MAESEEREAANGTSGAVMQPLQRILCPVDFSETSERALAYADRLAQGLGAELIVAHAFDIPQEKGLLGQDRPADQQLRGQLDALRVSTPAARVTRVLHAGPPAEVICWLAQQHGCDLIVMGTHGRTGLVHLLLGSVAEQVLRQARCPVLSIRHRPADEPPLPEPKVLPLPPPRLM